MLVNIERIKQNREEGFTLIEMVVTVLIIGILASIAIPALLNQRKSSIDSTVKGELKAAAVIIKTWSVSHPRATPDNTVLADMDKHPETTFTITSSGPGQFVITATNPKGDEAAAGLTFNSETDTL